MPGSPNRSVAVLAGSLFALALGEELWQVYVPPYLTALGASGVVVGLYGSARDLLDSLYQYPGGWLADTMGRRRTLMILTTIAIAGYATYTMAPRWEFVLLGLVAVMAWKAGAFPTTFAIIGDSVPRDRRAAAFAVQSVLVRVPRVVSAPLGGLIIASVGLVAGFRIACAVTVVMGGVVLLAQHFYLRDARPVPAAAPRSLFRWHDLPPELRRLLVADSMVRIGEGIAASFIVLYVTQVLGVAVGEYGFYYAIQQVIAIAFYLPAGRVADLTGRRPLVALTFVFFSLFPLAVRFAGSQVALIAAFAVGGLKEIGEPARKSLIVDLSPEDRRGATVGLYYGIRNMLVVPAGILGGVLWQQSPQLPLEVAFVVSGVGLVIFLIAARGDAHAPGRP